MSRSYKQNPVCTDNAHSGISRRKANRRYRRSSERVKSSTHWKRHTNPWDIREYAFRTSRSDAIRRWNSEGESGHLHKLYRTLDTYLNKEWAKYYKRK